MIFFYALFTIGIISAYCVVGCRNPVYSLLNLVVFFLAGSIHLLYLGVDFLAFVFIIVYVGAIAVLFLFVVIMLNIKAKAFNFKKEVFAVLAFSFFVLYCFTDPIYYALPYTQPKVEMVKFLGVYDHIPNIKALGYALYTRYLIHFVLCGLILLVSIIGAIVLTSKSRLEKPKVSENLSKQILRSSCIGKYKVE